MRTIRLAKVAGVSYELHYSWFVLAGLMVVSLAAHFALAEPAWSPIGAWLVATTTTLLFFVSVAAHELAHAAVAAWRKLPVRSICLSAFGGVAQIEREAADPGTELWMGVAGPLSTAALGVVYLAIDATAQAWLPGFSRSAPHVVLSWMTAINASLTVLNLIPGFPLDGGRIMRAILWKFRGDPVTATRVTARIGQGAGLALFLFSIRWLLDGLTPSAIWMACVAGFLFDGAATAYAEADETAALKTVRVREVMGRDYTAVDGCASLETFAAQYLFRMGQRCFLVMEHGQIAGIITASDIAHIDRDEWSRTRVEHVMRRMDDLGSIDPEALVSDALKTMRRERLMQLPVVANGRFEGVLQRGQIWHWVPEQPQLTM